MAHVNLKNDFAQIISQFVLRPILKDLGNKQVFILANHRQDDDLICCLFKGLLENYKILRKHAGEGQGEKQIDDHCQK